MPLVQLLIPLSLEVYVFYLLFIGHTRYQCFEGPWAFGRYLLQQITLIALLSLCLVNTQLFTVKEI